MTNLYSPDEIKGWEEIRPIDRAVILRGYREQVEAELERVKTLHDECCMLAREAGDIDTDEWKLQVRYASGTSRSPDAEMLAVEDPQAYARLYEEQLKKWRPKLTKTDLEWLYDDADQRKDMMERISVEHMVKPQYILVRKEGI